MSDPNQDDAQDFRRDSAAPALTLALAVLITHWFSLANYHQSYGGKVKAQMEVLVLSSCPSTGIIEQSRDHYSSVARFVESLGAIPGAPRFTSMTATISRPCCVCDQEFLD
jgi:hypothetical protein